MSVLDIRKELQAATLVTGQVPGFARYFSSQLFDFSSWARLKILAALQEGIVIGQLTIIEADETFTFGKDITMCSPIDPWSTRNREPGYATIYVKNNDFYMRIALHYDLGFAEAFLSGDCDIPDLKAVLNVWLDNRDGLTGVQTWFSTIHMAISSLSSRFFGQTLENAKLNAIAGYDTSNTLFESFLGKTMMYSSAMWSDEEGGVRGDLEDSDSGSCTPDSGYRSQTESLSELMGDRDIFPTTKSSGDALDSAQLRKVHYMLRQARVKAGDRVLEFGSGWGTMAIEAARLGCTVDTLTLSVEQQRLAEIRIAEAGLEKQIRVHLMDYRNMPSDWQGQFDAFVCSEMIEHVGAQHHQRFFQILDWALKPRFAAACITASSMPEHRYTLYQAEDYGRRYQWPNTHLPSATALAVSATTALPGAFILHSVEDQGAHYARTLREWGYRFKKNWTPELVAKIIEDQPQLADGNNLEAFRRKWEYMYVYAEVGFARAYAALNCWTFARPEYPSHRSD